LKKVSKNLKNSQNVKKAEISDLDIIWAAKIIFEIFFKKIKNSQNY
jgi:hypothetical protein